MVNRSCETGADRRTGRLAARTVPPLPRRVQSAVSRLCDIGHNSTHLSPFGALRRQLRRSIINPLSRTGIGMNKRSPAGLIVASAGLACALAGCSARTDMSVTANTPAQYSHVWITTQEIWFNTSAIAGPDDGGWEKFPLSTPATVDLVAESGGNLGSIVTGLNIIPGTYSQVRLIPVDATAALTTSASTAGALYNSEADYIDSAGVTHQLPLEFLNPDKGIGIRGRSQGAGRQRRRGAGRHQYREHDHHGHHHQRLHARQPPTAPRPARFSARPMARLRPREAPSAAPRPPRRRISSPSASMARMTWCRSLTPSTAAPRAASC